MWFCKKKDDKTTNQVKSDYLGISLTAEDMEGLTEGKVEYFIEESRTYLQFLSENANSIAGKASTLLTLVVGGLGYIIAEFIVKSEYYINHFWQISFWVGLFLVLSYDFYILIRYQLPQKCLPVGTQPKEIALKSVIKYGYRQILLKQLFLYQDRIDKNKKSNTQMAENIRRCFIFIVAYLGVAILIGLLIFLFDYFCLFYGR
ncbi:MAG: hypothetical protein ABSF37_05660 [Sedimentisphaerales bacterium]|jgi:hypothetical protein